MRSRTTTLTVSAMLALVALAAPEAWQAAPTAPQSPRPHFKGGVDIVNISVTVTDERGHLVTGLTKDDFRVYDDDVQQEVTHFGINPISLGIVVDASGSMDGARMRSARSALERFLGELRDPENEFFLYEFNNQAKLRQEWTRDRRDITRALSKIKPEGGTAMYDAVAAAVRMAAIGRHPRKAVLLVSDGNDDGSGKITEAGVLQLVRENEVAVYAIGIDGPNETTQSPRRPDPAPPAPRFPMPFPQGPPRRPGVFRQLPPQLTPWQIPEAQAAAPQLPPAQAAPPQSPPSRPPGLDSVNVRTLRSLTDDSGGRTEVVRSTRDLEPATTNIAKELSQQYYLGYPASPERDGRVHTIRVEVVKGRYTVRARRTYIAS